MVKTLTCIAILVVASLGMLGCHGTNQTPIATTKSEKWELSILEAKGANWTLESNVINNYIYSDLVITPFAPTGKHCLVLSIRLSRIGDNPDALWYRPGGPPSVKRSNGSELQFLGVLYPLGKPSPTQKGFPISASPKGIVEITFLSDASTLGASVQMASKLPERLLVFDYPSTADKFTLSGLGDLPPITFSFAPQAPGGK